MNIKEKKCFSIIKSRCDSGFHNFELVFEENKIAIIEISYKDLDWESNLNKWVIKEEFSNVWNDF